MTDTLGPSTPCNVKPAAYHPRAIAHAQAYAHIRDHKELRSV